MKVKLVDHMGTDLSVVNAARVSFAKESEWEYCAGQVCMDLCERDGTVCPHLPERDAKLIRYLARHGHWTPFGHTSVSIHVKAPIFVARQLAKHQVGLVWNEVSRRYVDDEPEFFFPETWRGRPEGSVKQGSGDGEIVRFRMTDGVEEWNTEPGSVYSAFISGVEHFYRCLIEGGVAPEQARMVLPQSMYTEWYWTGSIAAWARVCKLRLDSHAQKETREVAEQIDEVMEELFPISWKELMNYDD